MARHDMASESLPGPMLWSPCGGYLLAAHPAGGFTLWETVGWTSGRWETGGVPVSGAAWGPAPPAEAPLVRPSYIARHII